MKVKTSVTPSDTLLASIDRNAGNGANRSEFIENAVRSYIASLIRKEQNARDNQERIIVIPSHDDKPLQDLATKQLIGEQLMLR